MRSRSWKMGPNAALAEVLERDGTAERLRDGHGLIPTPVRQVGQPTPPRPFVIEPFDTSSFIDPPTNEPAEPDEPPATYPEPKRRRKWRRESETK